MKTNTPVERSAKLHSWFPLVAAVAMAILFLSLAAPAYGQIYVANYGAGSVVKFTGPGSGTNFATGLSSPQGVAVDSAGNVYATSGNTIMKYAPDGSGGVFVSTGLSNPWSLAFDPSGTYLYASNYNAGTIAKINSAGTVVETLNSGRSYVNGIAFDATGSLFVAATSAGAASPAIIKFTGTTPSNFTTSNLSDPKGLAFDSTGNLYVSNNSGSTIYKFTSGGSSTLFADSGDGLSNPYGLAFTNSGLLLVANFTGGKILSITSGGVASEFGTGLTNPNNLTVAAVPEPATYGALAGLAALALGVWRRRRQE